MAIIIDTPTIHKSLAQLVLSLTPNACVYDNPNQQGTHLPAWFIVHREPVDIKEDLHGRWWLNYHIDLFYMLDFNGPHLFDDYAAIADQLGEISEYLPIYGYENVVTHTYERSWGMYMDALKFSMNLKFRVTKDATPPAYMEVIEDLRVFLKGLKQEFYTLSFTNTDHPDFTVELPDDIVVSANAFVKLPSVSDKHTEDEKTWVTSRWDIGEFGSSVKMDEDKVANLLWEELQQFVVSFANTTYPQFDVDLPEQAAVIAGESITLPSVSGQFVDDGYVYTPSAWDIGDFGSEFTPTGNTIANLVFNVEKQYEEVTLYMASGSKRCQLSVSSSFTGNVDSERVYQLYTDEECTTPWTGYDYSNDYEVGHYVNGEWNLYTDSVSAMPSSTAILGIGYILMDTGALWLCCNSRSSMSVTITNIVVRIYPKGQQQYPLYFSQNSNTYNNYSTSGGMVYMMKHRPGNLSYGWMPWSDSFPTRTIVKALYSSGKSNIAIDRLSWNGTDNISIKLASGYSPSFRNVIFTLDVPTYTSWADLSGNKSAEANEVCPLFDKNGEYVVYDPTVSYTIIGLFNYSGGHPFNSPNRFMLNAQLGAFDTNNPTRLCFKLNRAVTFSYVWYIKTQTS